MILFVESIACCIVFGIVIVGSTVKRPTFWLNEYPEPIQKRYMELHPESRLSKPDGHSKRVILKKLLGSVLLLFLIFGMVYFAGARTFLQGCIYCYILWTVVNVFDTLVLDIGILAHWKKCRLPGTEDMDEEYKLLTKRSLINGLRGFVIGIPMAAVIGLITILI